MSKKNLTPNVSEHIKQFRIDKGNGKRLTQKEAAKLLGISVPSLKRYEHGISCPTDSTAKVMQGYTGIIYPYWTGITDCKDWESYKEERIANAQKDREDEERKKALREEGYRKKMLFEVCGYKYSVTDGNTASSKHYIANFEDLSKKTCFSDDEFNTLLSDIRSLIEFKCFKKEQKGNQP